MWDCKAPQGCASAAAGYNVCIFAYGQTGSGKTHTMAGSNVENLADRGINYRALDDLFAINAQRAGEVSRSPAIWHIVLALWTAEPSHDAALHVAKHALGRTALIVNVGLSNALQAVYTVRVQLLEVYNEQVSASMRFAGVQAAWRRGPRLVPKAASVRELWWHDFLVNGAAAGPAGRDPMSAGHQVHSRQRAQCARCHAGQSCVL